MVINIPIPNFYKQIFSEITKTISKYSFYIFFLKTVKLIFKIKSLCINY